MNDLSGSALLRAAADRLAELEHGLYPDWHPYAQDAAWDGTEWRIDHTTGKDQTLYMPGEGDPRDEQLARFLCALRNTAPAIVAWLREFADRWDTEVLDETQQKGHVFHLFRCPAAPSGIIDWVIPDGYKATNSGCHCFNNARDAAKRIIGVER